MAETILQMILGVLISVVCGYGLVGILWPREQDEYRHIITPCVGYPSLILLTHFVSGTFRLDVQTASVIAFVLLAVLAVSVWWTRDRPAGFAVLSKTGHTCLLALPMLAVVLWPLFVVGAETYQATVNPDFLVSLLDNEWLKSHPTDAIRPSDPTNPRPIFGSPSESARFRASYFAILLEVLFDIPQRAGLALAIGLFHFCMPLALYVMARLALGQSKKVAVLSVLLFGISSSISLGYLCYYIGQTSGLGFLGLVITAWFLCLTQPGVKVFLLAMVLTSALWVLYLGLVPYAGAPVLGLFLCQLFSRQLRWKTALMIVLASIVFLALTHIRMMGMFLRSFQGWASLGANAQLPQQYFIDFVTERFFPMFYGLTIYPLETSRLRDGLGRISYLLVIFGLSLCISLGLLLSFLRWVRITQDKRHLAVGISCAVAYSGVTFYYIFVQPYGYAAFKQTIWLQFGLMFLAAIGICWVYDVISGRSAKWKKAIGGTFLVVAIVPFVAGNLFSSWEYGMIGLGHDTEKGNMVVVHNMSGNEDYFELAPALSKVVKKNESIGVSLVNIGQQGWAMYYLRDFRLSYLGQWQFPGDDQTLPGINTGRVIDAQGGVILDSQPFYHSANDDYFLVNQPGTVNGEIVKNRYPKAVWENSTFKLVRACDTPDFLFVGRGFYRSEYRTSNAYYVPQALKWTAEGGELYLFRARQRGVPYRLAFTAYTGPGLNSSRRTLEFFHNRRKFGRDAVINGFGRVVSDPFYPEGGVDTLVIRVKERVPPPARPFMLTKMSLPLVQHKRNLSVSAIELIIPDKVPDQPRLGQAIRGADLFTKSYSFNGIEPDQWVREAMSFSMPRPSGASSVTLLVKAPDLPQLRFPLHLKLTVDGVETLHTMQQPGTVALKAALASSNIPEPLTELGLEPDQWFSPAGMSPLEREAEIISRLGWDRLNQLIADAIRRSSRPVVRSVRLESFQFD